MDYIIVGQGLAGSAVAVQLLKRNKKIFVVDELAENTSSRIAAGLYNPVTGKKAVKTWMADRIFPYLEKFYSDLEKQTNRKFLFPMVLYRPFASVQEQNEWMGKSADDMYLDYIVDISTSSRDTGINDRFGGILLKHSGYLNTATYLSVVRDWIREESIISHETFDESLVESGAGVVKYRDVAAKKIIFCQGERSFENKWFGKVPIRPLKGETLLIKTEWKTDFIINRGVYIVPGNEAGEYRVGSTYSYNDRSPNITESGFVELKQKLEDLLVSPYTVLKQDWGVRPTTIDRRPLLGNHPTHENFVIFNGLGTKGVSLAPYFSEVLIRWLENGDPLNKEVSVARYK